MQHPFTKRFQVIDLFCGDDHIDDIIEWIDAKNQQPNNNGIFKVKLDNRDEIIAYYCITFPCGWVRKENKEMLKNVTHWGRFRKE